MSRPQRIKSIPTKVLPLSMFSQAIKPSQFPKHLTPDAAIPTMEASESATPELLRKARKVSGSFTWVVPEQRSEYELKWLSKAALQDLGLENNESSPESLKEIADILSGEKHIIDKEKGIYPFAQNYAGDQFGSWAGQLGDGRAITLFRIGDYDIQLKGGGLTPYSRFADGKAVLRSSIREALASEYINQLGIPTQRCLSLVNLPKTAAHRERVETCAVIARMARSWVRIGSFQLHHSRGDRAELRRLADYCINELGLGADSRKEGVEGNRYFHLFRDVALRNASMMARTQSYGFLNGVLNTDNVSVLGLSIDYGPFAFMDVFDSSYTPNHDDYMSRYGFQSAPVVMWWNCIKLSETLGELIGSGDNVDNPEFIEKGVTSETQESVKQLATKLIMSIGEEYQNCYETKYQEHMLQRIGIFNSDETGDLKLIEEMLLTLQECEINYNAFFRRLVSLDLDPVSVLPKERERKAILSDKDAIKMVNQWFEKYRIRRARDPISEEDRQKRMQGINPKFVLHNSVIANVIELAEKGNWDAFHAVANMSYEPFAESWSNVPEIYSKRYLSEIPLDDRDCQLSCSS